METKLKLDFLDHVAIRVSDIDRSINWYQKVLDLEKYQLKEWGSYPIFMLSNKCGVAIFPSDEKTEALDQNVKRVKIDHFAFNVDKENFELARKKYERLNIEFQIQDHFYFESIYTKDPDGHTVELTTIKVNEDDFYYKNQSS